MPVDIIIKPEGYYIKPSEIKTEDVMAALKTFGRVMVTHQNELQRVVGAF